MVWNFFSLLLIATLSFSCGSKIAEERKVVFTQLPAATADVEEITNGSYRYASGMKIVLADIAEKLEVQEVLTNDFNSARAPEISYDGKQLVFSAQNKQGDVWQLWTMDVESREVFQVTESETNCTDPTWLPDERIAFSKQIRENGLEHHALFTIGVDGCCEQRITFQPHEDLNASVLHDGRILVSSQQMYPEPGTIKYLAMRPDGTKAELFYPSAGSAQFGKAIENGAGSVLFAEAGILNSVKFSRPLHTKSVIQPSSVTLVQAIYPVTPDEMLASVNKTGESSFGLELQSSSQAPEKNLYYNNPDFHAIEPVVIKPRPLSKKLPTRVNVERETGYFVCMDTDQSELDLGVEAGTTAKVQVLGLENVLGETEVFEDGSFYLELKADQPVRFQTLNEAGEVLRGPSSWMWVRPNERRGCVGCHEDREMSPNNIVPKAMEKAPFAIIK